MADVIPSNIYQRIKALVQSGRAFKVTLHGNQGRIEAMELPPEKLFAEPRDAATQPGDSRGAPSAHCARLEEDSR